MSSPQRQPISSLPSSLGAGSQIKRAVTKRLGRILFPLLQQPTTIWIDSCVSETLLWFRGSSVPLADFFLSCCLVHQEHLKHTQSQHQHRPVNSDSHSAQQLSSFSWEVKLFPPVVADLDSSCFETAHSLRQKDLLFSNSVFLLASFIWDSWSLVKTLIRSLSFASVPFTFASISVFCSVLEDFHVSLRPAFCPTDQVFS